MPFPLRTFASKGVVRLWDSLLVNTFPLLGKLGEKLLLLIQAPDEAVFVYQQIHVSRDSVSLERLRAIALDGGIQRRRMKELWMSPATHRLFSWSNMADAKTLFSSCKDGGVLNRSKLPSG